MGVGWIRKKPAAVKRWARIFLSALALGFFDRLAQVALGDLVDLIQEFLDSRFGFFGVDNPDFGPDILFRIERKAVALLGCDDPDFRFPQKPLNEPAEKLLEHVVLLERDFCNQIDYTIFPILSTLNPNKTSPRQAICLHDILEAWKRKQNRQQLFRKLLLHS